MPPFPTAFRIPTLLFFFQVSDFVVENPADVPVVMQILPLPLYPHPQTALDMVSERVAADLENQYIEMNDIETFVLPDLQDINVSILLLFCFYEISTG